MSTNWWADLKAVYRKAEKASPDDPDVQRAVFTEEALRIALKDFDGSLVVEDEAMAERWFDYFNNASREA